MGSRGDLGEELYRFIVHFSGLNAVALRWHSANSLADEWRRVKTGRSMFPQGGS